jgi:hypothetical protein
MYLHFFATPCPLLLEVHSTQYRGEVCKIWLPICNLYPCCLVSCSTYFFALTSNCQVFLLEASNAQVLIFLAVHRKKKSGLIFWNKKKPWFLMGTCHLIVGKTSLKSTVNKLIDWSFLWDYWLLIFSGFIKLMFRCHFDLISFNVISDLFWPVLVVFFLIQIWICMVQFFFILSSSQIRDLFMW